MGNIVEIIKNIPGCSAIEGCTKEQIQEAQDAL